MISAMTQIQQVGGYGYNLPVTLESIKRGGSWYNDSGVVEDDKEPA